MPRCALALAVVSLSSTAALARAEERNVPDFNAVNVASGIRATVEIGPRRPVRVEAKDDVLDLVETRVENGTLHIGLKPHSRWMGESRVNARIRRSLSGGWELHVRGGAKARVGTSGGSSVEIED